MTLLHTSPAPLTCECDALLRATSLDPTPFHRPGCPALLCRDCGQHRTSHVIGVGGVLVCPDGRGSE